MIETGPTAGSVAGAVGMLLDRTLEGGEIICNAWLIDDHKAVTLASAVLPFEKNLEALSVNFAKAGKECGVAAVSFHPNFDKQLAATQLKRGISFDSWESALQKYNCAILQLSDEVVELTTQDFEAVQKIFMVKKSSEDSFSGSLKNIELPLVLQTISGSAQEGVLYLCDDSDRPVAQMLFKDGTLLSARYKNLCNEAAVYQIVQRQLNGKFLFVDCDIAEWLEWLPAGPISKSAEMILLEAMRRYDELTELKRELHADKTYFVRARPQIDSSELAEDVRAAAELVWRVLDGMTVAEDLWLLVGMDDYSVFRVLEELNLKDQVRRVQEGGTRQISSAEIKGEPFAKWAPLPLGQDLPLAPDEPLTAVGLDIDAVLAYASSGGLGRALKSKFVQSKSAKKQSSTAAIDQSTTKTRIKSGNLLGAIDAYDSVHLLHEAALLPRAGGAPLLKDGVVVGMHCGVVPFSIDQENVTGIKQVMLWIGAVLECLKAAGELEFSKKFIQSTNEQSERRRISPPGCNQIAALKCPSCGAETFDSARTCKKCEHSFVPLRELETAAEAASAFTPPPDFGPAISKTVRAVSLISMIGLATVVALSFVLPTPASQNPQLVVLDVKPVDPSESLVKLRTMWSNPFTRIENWIAKPSRATLTNDDKVKFQVDAFQPSYVYVFAKGRWSSQAAMIYPVITGKKNLLEARQALHTSKFRVKPPKGNETVLVVASREPQPWLEEPAWYNSVYDLSTHLPQSSLFDSGVIVSVEKNEASSKDANKGANNPIAELFLASVSVDH